MPSWSPSTPSSSIPLGSEGDSHLLSQSLPSPDPFDASSHIHTGPGGADLSLSELSLSDKPYSRDGPRFSLLAPPPAPSRFSTDQSTIIEGEECEEGDASVDSEHDDANNTMMARVDAEKAREEKLQSDLFVLKKLNASFAVLNDALRATQGATEVCLTLGSITASDVFPPTLFFSFFLPASGGATIADRCAVGQVCQSACQVRDCHAFDFR